MKKAIVAMIVASTFVATNVNATGIPVVDVANNAQVMINQIANMAQYVEQVVQLKNQLEQARATFNSLNGIRGMAGLLNNPVARQYLPKESRDLYSLYSGAGAGKFAGLSGKLKAIKEASRVIKSSDIINGKTSAGLEKSQNLLASLQATAEESYDQAGKRFEQLQALVDKVDDAPDAKAAADLQNRIQAEQVMMQNELTKLNMMKQLQDIQEKQLAQQYKEETAKMGRGEVVY